MRLGIDASNLRTGGGITHLVELLRAAEPRAYGISRVTVWGGKNTLQHLPERPWLECVHEPLLDQALPARLYWQQRKLPGLAQRHCDLLFAPGGSSRGRFRPYVTMSRNLQPFERAEWRRYGCSLSSLRLLLLRYQQIRSLRRADGVIFLTEYARSLVGRMAGLDGTQLVIPHGIHSRFFLEPREQKPISQFSLSRPFTLLYVSKLEPYKHQWRVVEAIGMLKNKLPIALCLVGDGVCPTSTRRLRETIRRVDPHEEFIHWLGDVPHEKLPDCYHNADGFIFASSCENLPNILLEAMAAGLPIACSDRGPMPEVLGPAGVYFNPERTAEIAAAVQLLVEDSALRHYFADTAHARARQYSWERCANETFSHLAAVASSHPQAVGEAFKPVSIH